MNKKILFCCDGSWETRYDQTTEYEGTNSNVLKMYRATLKTSNQIAFYQPGVGCDMGYFFDRPLPSLRGGATGAGIDRKIKEAYLQIAEVYKPGDEIFLFGWSRGAYTARSLASMICEFGLPTKPFNPFIADEVFLVYRDPSKRESLLNYLEIKYGLFKPYIQFVGVLDTVGSLGVPALEGGVSQPRYGFLNTDLHPNILNAYQAIALDECRHEYPITMWNNPIPPVQGQVCEQIYFAGCHGNVGGDTPEGEPGLCEIPLKWMANKASSLGLDIHPALLAKDQLLSLEEALAPIYESWSPIWGKREYREVSNTAMLSNSVAIRCELDPKYRPQNLNFINGKLDPSYRIVDVLN